MPKVRNILKEKGNAIYSIAPNQTVYEALEMLVDKNIGALVVLDKDKFVGIFTERDYARKVILKGKASKETLIGEIMNPDPISTNSDEGLEQCMNLMTNKFTRHLPVIDDGKLVGLISIGDLVKYMIDEQKFIIENLEHYIAGQK
ncbi:CBS domain-containing protein [Solitalea koreensis]|uniref:CBS domain-containing protein n=1 Tax=Solitalea koreensis TaxID=543615 RepID=A0A521ALB9_9SPHI|nr:CBS domain-containing protein [Solitalea koreensis]SMO35608.1 CBS domain-containing protein [Solitalea koreensis]